MTEPITDYSEPIIKARKHLQNLEHLLRLKRFEEAMEQVPLIEAQCIKLRNYIYMENEK